jgi:hypothetical protein
VYPKTPIAPIGPGLSARAGVCGERLVGRIVGSTSTPAALEELREQANTDTESLAQAVRDAFDLARENLSAATTPEALTGSWMTSWGRRKSSRTAGFYQSKRPQPKLRAICLST